jgi:hypothetical protein
MKISTEGRSIRKEERKRGGTTSRQAWGRLDPPFKRRPPDEFPSDGQREKAKEEATWRVTTGLTND